MYAKAAYWCTVMVVVQCRVVLYGTAIIDLVSSRSPDGDNALGSSNEAARYDSTEENDNGMSYLVYDFGSKMIQFLSDNSPLPEFSTYATSLTPDFVDSSIPLKKLRTATHQVQSKKGSQVHTKTDFLNDSKVDLYTTDGNETIVSNGYSGINDSDLLSDIIRRMTPGLAAMGYEN